MAVLELLPSRNMHSDIGEVSYNRTNGTGKSHCHLWDSPAIKDVATGKWKLCHGWEASPALVTISMSLFWHSSGVQCLEKSRAR